MKTRFILPLLLFVVAGIARAQPAPNCPWLSTGSAAIALGGDVTVTAHSESNWEGACRFERQAASQKRAIDIHISKANGHPCPSVSRKLRALGNEAVECRRVTANGNHADTIAGRVRDAWFEVTITGVPDVPRELPADSDPNRANMLERIAEQVAGNLY